MFQPRQGCFCPQGTERQIHCLTVHPSRPHLAATGSSGGTVAVWDLRFGNEPTLHVLPGSADVWQVCAASHVRLFQRSRRHPRRREAVQCKISGDRRRHKVVPGSVSSDWWRWQHVVAGKITIM